jgi:O-methyltransferase involved in polyketide biosynthesis
MTKLILQSQDNIDETLLIALYARAVEARMHEPMLHDSMAPHLVEQIDYDFSRLKLNGHDQATTIMRLREFDRITQVFLNLHPHSVVVHIGCGLDTRFERVDNGIVKWYDLDLPEVIELRHKLITGTDRCQTLPYSVFDQHWITLVENHPRMAYLFLAEGVFPYFTETQVKGLFLLLKDKFPGCELVCDGMTPAMVRLHNLKLSNSRLDVRLHWNLKNGRQPESWGSGIKMLSEWFYFDSPEPRLGSAQLMRYLPLLARGVGIFHYQLGDKPKL